MGLKGNCNGIFLGGLMCRDIPNFEEMRGVRIDDYSMFTSPWAISIEDEKIFNETTNELGKVLFLDNHFFLFRLKSSYLDLT